MSNTALIGAKMFMFANHTLHQDILAKAKHIKPEGDPNFQDIYVDKMLLKYHTTLDQDPILLKPSLPLFIYN
ncbi:MAG: hypothetical protein Q8N05_08060 [Bacteroidota bacterium]|nr:hypothetical protein [Bacteroidota bacterium]